MVTVLFRNGHVVGMSPKPVTSYYDSRSLIYDADRIWIDDQYYNLSDKEQIYSIPVPNYGEEVNSAISNELGVTGYLEYILRMKASAHKNRGEDDLAYACLGQATKLMLYSDLGWREKDFWRIVEWLKRDGRLKYAAKWEAWIKEHVPTETDKTLDQFRQTVQACKKLGTDLVYISWSRAQSAAVSKYQGRVYTLTGKDKRFPILPDFIWETGCVVPPLGGCVSGPFIMWDEKSLDTIYYKGKDTPVLKASWRPFKDDRSQEEKEAFRKLQYERLLKEHRTRNSHLYDNIRTHLPVICPKSISTFYRWKTSKPEQYQLILDAAAERQIPIPHQEFKMPEVFEPADPDPSYNGGRRRPLFF